MLINVPLPQCYTSEIFRNMSIIGKIIRKVRNFKLSKIDKVIIVITVQKIVLFKSPKNWKRHKLLQVNKLAKNYNFLRK